MITKRNYDSFTFGVFYTGGFSMDIAFGWIGFSYFFKIANDGALQSLPEMPPIQCQKCGSYECLSIPFEELK